MHVIIDTQAHVYIPAFGNHQAGVCVWYVCVCVCVRACVRACARACVRAYGRVCVFKIVTAECFAAVGILEGLNTVFIQPGDINHAGVARPVAKFMSVGYVPLAEA